MREMLHGHRLQPDPPRTRERGEEDAVTAEERVLDAGYGGDVELDRFLVHAHVPRMDAQRVAGLKVVHDDLPVQLHPRLSLALKPLHPESRAAEDSRAELLLEPDRELHARGGAHETMPVDHVALA